MSTLKKPSAKSPLQMLPEERQEQIIEWLKTRSVAETRKQLADDGFHTSMRALSEFYSWWQRRQQAVQNERRVEDFMERLRQKSPALSESEVFQSGQQMFSLLAMEQEDNLGWVRIQKENTRKELVAIERRKFQRQTCELFLKWFEEKQARQIATSTASNAQKIEALGRKMFGEDWE